MANVTLHLSHSGSDVSLSSSDELVLDFQIAGYFCTRDRDAFHPPLPNGHCAPGACSGPYKPKHKNHDTSYSFDPSHPCDHPGSRPMHTIHTGN
jgi:hypothetical protein